MRSIHAPREAIAAALLTALTGTALAGGYTPVRSYHWIGPDTGSWLDEANWNGDGVPNAIDHNASIGSFGHEPPTLFVTLDEGDIVVNRLILDNAHFFIGADAQFRAVRAITGQLASGAVILDSGQLTIASRAFEAHRLTMGADTRLVLESGANATIGTASLNGSVLIDSGATLSVAGGGGDPYTDITLRTGGTLKGPLSLNGNLFVEYAEHDAPAIIANLGLFTGSLTVDADLLLQGALRWFSDSSITVAPHATLAVEGPGFSALNTTVTGGGTLDFRPVDDYFLLASDIEGDINIRLRGLDSPSESRHINITGDAAYLDGFGHAVNTAARSILIDGASLDSDGPVALAAATSLTVTGSSIDSDSVITLSAGDTIDILDSSLREVSVANAASLHIGQGSNAQFRSVSADAVSVDGGHAHFQNLTTEAFTVAQGATSGAVSLHAQTVDVHGFLQSTRDLNASTVTVHESGSLFLLLAQHAESSIGDLHLHDGATLVWRTPLHIDNNLTIDPSDDTALHFRLVTDQHTRGAVLDDALVVGGHASLSGVAHIDLFSDPDTLGMGDSFTILTADEGLSGAFTSLVAPELEDGLFFALRYDDNAVRLVVVPAPAGSLLLLAAAAPQPRRRRRRD